MNIFTLNKTVVLLLCILSFLSCTTITKQVKKQPNVIILLTDDQGYGDLSCHGNPDVKTPHLDKLYNESIRFTNFHVAPVCTPTRSQLLTGIDAVRNGASGVGDSRTSIFHTFQDTLGNESEIHLMSEFFKANGYQTAHFGKWHLGDHYPCRSMDRGFDETLTFPGASIWQSPNYWNNDGFNAVNYRNGKEEKTKGYFTDVYFSETINFIKKATEKAKPFFVYLPTGAMHTPLFVAEKYSTPYRYLPPLTAQFYGMVANFDENFGKLDVTLEELGIKENTIVIYMTDNGGTLGVDFYNAGMKGKKGSFYDGGHRVPCFIRWTAGLPHPASDFNELTLVQDILPTLIDLCELETPWKQKFDGLSLKELMMGKTQDLSKRKSVVQYVHNGDLKEFTVMKNKWRLLNGTELYNVQYDQGQKNNVINENPELANELQTYYESWKKSVQPSESKRNKILVGHPELDVVELNCFDWSGTVGKGKTSQMNDIRQGMSMAGHWTIQAERQGNYEISFRRWHAAAKTAITAGLPPYFSEFSKQINVTEASAKNEKYQMWKTICLDGVYPKGKALPIAQAQFIVNDYTETIPVINTDEAIVLKKYLTPGDYKLQMNFLDKHGKVLCGAYYGTIKRL